MEQYYAPYPSAILGSQRESSGKYVTIRSNGTATKNKKGSNGFIISPTVTFPTLATTKRFIAIGGVMVPTPIATNIITPR